VNRTTTPIHREATPTAFFRTNPGRQLRASDMPTSRPC
jgi:hypothetical protein